MGRDADDPGCCRVLLQHLPDDLLGHVLAPYAVAAVHGPEYLPLRQLRLDGPSVDRDLHPGRHRHRSDSTVLPNEIDDAPATLPLLNVDESERSHLRPPQSAADQ